MGVISTGLGIAITSLSLNYADLPTTATSYDGEVRDISQFYNQKIPEFNVGFGIELDDTSWISGNFYTGTYTDKLTVLPTIEAKYNKGWSLKNDWNLVGSIGTKINLGSKDKPCSDGYDRQYYCGNLTAWSDYEGNTNVKVLDTSIGFSLTKRF